MEEPPSTPEVEAELRRYLASKTVTVDLLAIDTACQLIMQNDLDITTEQRDCITRLMLPLLSAWTDYDKLTKAKLRAHWADLRSRFDSDAEFEDCCKREFPDADFDHIRLEVELYHRFNKD